MTGPNPDAELDDALGIRQLPPAVVTDEHMKQAAKIIRTFYTRRNRRGVAQVIADLEQRAVARYIAEQRAAGTTL
jgi:hypothetical protein